MVDNTPVKKILNSYQIAEDPVYVVEEKARIKTFSRHLTKINSLRPNKGKLLDIGAYTGVFLHLARQSGWEVSGIDPSSWAVSQAKIRYKINLRQTILRKNLFKKNMFDVITMWDVIEHFNDPIEAVEISHSLLKPGGILVMTTMDIASPISRLLREKWPWLMRMHRVYFSRETMRKMLINHSFSDIIIRPHIRWVSVRYLSSRFNHHHALTLLHSTGLGNIMLPFYAGDLFDVYATRD